MPSPDDFEYTIKSAQIHDHERRLTYSGRSPLSLNIGFLKNLTEKKGSRNDGQPPKKRGPKPDTKPALTRRQELNRQAQRTHRERKELYIKALEQEVLRLKENFSIISRDKDAIAEENNQLKNLLSQHGIIWTGRDGAHNYTRKIGNDNVPGANNLGSFALGSQTFRPPPPLTSPSNSNFKSKSPPDSSLTGRGISVNQNQEVIDYDQTGVDFVLTLERPCMDHMQFLVERASEPGGEPCGHALMASCPPDAYSVPYPDQPFKPYSPEQNNTAQKTWDVSKPDLASLLDLSKKLNLDGEITPVMAWGMVLAHSTFHYMGKEDFENICKILSQKIRCYGFGAVLEEFEVRDAIESVFSAEVEKK